MRPGRLHKFLRCNLTRLHGLSLQKLHLYLTIGLQDEDMNFSLKQILETPRGIATVVLECISYAAMLPFIYIEVRTVMEYWDDWLNAWNALDVLAYSFQVRNCFKVK